jgi:hypothetical protein
VADVTPLMNDYRECVRHLWNTHFRSQADANLDWDMADQFNAIAAQLFEALVLTRVGSAGLHVQPDSWLPRAVLDVLHVVVEHRSEIMVNRDRDGGYWDHPVTTVEAGELDLRFLQYFDWDVLGTRDLAYYRVRIVSSLKYPELVGKDALVPVGPSVKVHYEGAAERADAADEARGN